MCERLAWKAVPSPQFARAAPRPSLTPPNEVAAYVFVDVDLPRDGASRLDLFASDTERALLRAAARDGLISAFSEAELRALIRDAGIREQFRAELQPLPTAVYEEPIPVPPEWRDAPCAYLGFSAVAGSYAASVRHGEEEGWPLAELRGRHLHMLVEPVAVARAPLELAEACGMQVAERA